MPLWKNNSLAIFTLLLNQVEQSLSDRGRVCLTCHAQEQCGRVPVCAGNALHVLEDDKTSVLMSEKVLKNLNERP